MNRITIWASVCVLLALCAGPAWANVVIDTVPVGNLGNVGELSGDNNDFLQWERICGAVNYAYNIGQYEVTAGQYTEFLNAVAATDTYGLYNAYMSAPTPPTTWPYNNGFGCNIQRSGTLGSHTYNVASDWANRPVNYVSWEDAARFANWLHNGQPSGAQGLGTTEDGSYFINGASPDALLAVVRKPDATWVIPSEDEWYKAAYHKNDGVTGNYWDYPTNSNSPPGYVNSSGNLSGTGTPFTEDGIDPGNYATYNDVSIDGIGSPYYRTEAGEWENSGSPYGTFDQGGNVGEWNEARIGSYRGFRGGSLFSYADHLHASYRSYFLLCGPPTYESRTTGFRVALVPEPATIVMLALASLGIFRKRRA